MVVLFLDFTTWTNGPYKSRTFAEILLSLQERGREEDKEGKYRENIICTDLLAL